MVYTFQNTSVIDRKPFQSSPKEFFDGSVIHQYDFRDFAKVSDRSESHGIESESKLQTQATRSTPMRLLDAKRGGSIDSLVDSSLNCSGRSGGVQMIHKDAELPSKILPPWTLSLVASLQSAPISRCTEANISPERALSFEKQFGWDILLCTRMGSAWQVAQNRSVDVSLPSLPEGEIVKEWSGRQRKLMKILNVTETSTWALDVGCQNGLACVGTQKGEVSLWDIEKRRCVSSVCCQVTTALFMDSTTGMTYGAGMENQRDGRYLLCVGDHRSLYEPIVSWAKAPNGEDNAISGDNVITGVKCRKHELCIAGGGALWVLDLRKLRDGKPIMSFSADEVKKSKAEFKNAMEEEAESNNNSCWIAREEEEEEDLGDECGPMIQQDVSMNNNRSGSFMSLCKSLIRSMSKSSSCNTTSMSTLHPPLPELCESIA